ncbi:MAG: glucose-6-phosphate isomerase [Bdellovibrionales bacterium]|nr:glucose-6-phosphate isomerase [Bdellovibrionales bacterium]
MDSKALWQRYCDFVQFYPEVQFSIDISRMRFAPNFLETIRPRVLKAFSDMQALESGAIANPDEGRMVGHYWLRAPELAPDEKLRTEIAQGITELQRFAAQVHSGEVRPEKGGRFENVLLIGIGGSALGPQLVSDALWHQSDPMKMFFCDNTDPDGIARTLTQLGDDLAKTLVIVISKSGGTVETRNGSLEVARAYEAKGLKYGPHVVAVTCEDSKLDRQAKSEQWLRQFYMWDWVGGRTSIFSGVGLLPAALQGIDIEQFLEGARAMDRITRIEEPLRNPAALLAQMWYAAGDGKGLKDMVVLPYKDRLMLFSKYLQQLVMESLGKEHDLDGKTVNQGIAVYGNKGSTDQHAYVQQLRDGLNNFFVTFVEVLQDYTASSENVSNMEVEPGVTSGDYLNGFFQGTRRALFEGGRDSITVTIDELNARTLGSLIALYDRTVGLYATLVNINAYHQPGVEAGKKAAANVVELQKQVLEELARFRGGNERKTADELAAAVQRPDEAETIYKILEHLAANPQRGVERSGDRGPTTSTYRMV